MIDGGPRALLAAALGALIVVPPMGAGAQGALLEPGVSLELARHRAATLRDVRYDLAFRVPADRRAPVHGALELRFHRLDDGPVILDFADPGRVRGVSIDGAPIRYDVAPEHVILPAASLAAGENAVRIEFVAADGPLNRHDDFLYTLFVPARAREAFPAFDQPNLKARYRLRLTVPREWVAVANGAAVERREEGADVVYHFEETAPLPTYLFAFAAGRFQVEEAERDGRAMRLFHRETDPESLARNRAAIFDLHATALAWLEEYTGIPYPFGPFDFVAVPSFQYNGMEHPGAILYRASSLFLDESATRNQELGRASLIAHETAHMWFGDLVTMPWFDDVWMKEVFANFMAARIVHPSFPDLDHELRFLLAHYPAAYAVDRTPGANPIRQELDNLDDAGSLYGAIIYQKAPIVMRQLERLAGAEAFRTAVRRYLADHAFGNASWTDLVAALDDVTPLDVRAWSRVWIEEPGRPTIRVARHAAGVTLTQQDPRGRGFRWPQSVTVRAPVGDDWLERPAVLDDDVVLVPLPEPSGLAVAPILPNGAGLGYGLFLLDDLSRDALLHGLPSLSDPLARAVAWIGLHEMMLEGDIDPRAMLDLAAATLAVEDDELVAQEVLGGVVSLFWRWLDAPQRAAYAPRMEELLWNRTEEADGAGRKAAHFNAWRAVATTPEALDRMERIWAGELVVSGLPLAEQDFTTLALHLALRDVPHARDILDQQEERIGNPDRLARFRFVRCAVDPDPAVRAGFFTGLADVENRRREEWVVTALQYLNHPLRGDERLGSLRPALDLLREIRDTGDIFFPTRWLDATLGSHSDPAAAAIVRAFMAEQDDYPPRLMGKLLQAADPLFRAVTLRLDRPPPPPPSPPPPSSPPPLR